jgi:hypothetical protein
MDNGSAMPYREAAVGPTARPRGDLVRPGLYDNSSWQQILLILEEKGFERDATAVTVGVKGCL